MAKKPGDRHSAVNRDPVTIDLEGDDVKRLDDNETGTDGGAPAAAEPTPMQPEDAPESGESSLSPKTPQEDHDVVESSGSEADDPGIADETAGLEAERTDPDETIVPQDESDTEIADQTAMVGDTSAQSEAGKTGTEEEERNEHVSETAYSSDEEDETVTSSAPTSREENGRSGIGGVTAFLLGALLVALGLGTAVWLGYVPLTDTQQTAGTEELQQQIDELKAEIAEQPSEAGEATGIFSDEFEALRNEVQEISETVSSGGAGETAGLQTLSDRIAALEEAEGDSPAGGDEARQALDNANQQVAALDERLGTVQNELASLRDSVKEGGSTTEQTRSTLSNLDQQVGDISAQISQISASVSTLDDQISDLGDRLEKVEQLANANRSQEKVARAIAASSLRSAIESGQPFENELETAKTLGAGGSPVQTLSQYAAQGVKTPRQLAENVSEIADRMREAAAPPPSASSSDGIFDRITSGARSLVTIRRVGDAQDEGAQSSVTRFEQAVEAGELETALSEYESLPTEVQEPARSFADDLRATIEARKNLPDVIAAIGAGGNASASSESGSGPETTTPPEEPSSSEETSEAPPNDPSTTETEQ
ncbi:COG4223 family protein [Notoacmeibacter ruber]|uniref:Phage tail protein n=1 Tax=Notoacmeibacter ruber TaxID=2670375 RepID=A0A3L7JEB0_9HYPH|nr:hypothetical protein [Notoacmeibacter ruber]RLQ89013.1 hypothetical protein D8780_12990 [Notoacmeibacter ruber]